MSFKYSRKINYYETDRMGVVHHSDYIRFLEEARCRWLESLSFSMEKIEGLGYTIPTLEVYCKYKYHVTSGDEITIKPSVVEYNGVRMKINYEVLEAKTGKTVIEAWTTHCFTNRELKPANMKKNNKDIYELFENLFNEAKNMMEIK